MVLSKKGPARLILLADKLNYTEICIICTIYLTPYAIRIRTLFGQQNIQLLTEYYDRFPVPIAA